MVKAFFGSILLQLCFVMCNISFLGGVFCLRTRNSIPMWQEKSKKIKQKQANFIQSI